MEATVRIPEAYDWIGDLNETAAKGYVSSYDTNGCSVHCHRFDDGLWLADMIVDMDDNRIYIEIHGEGDGFPGPQEAVAGIEAFAVSKGIVLPRLSSVHPEG